MNTPINSGLLQSDLDCAGFDLLNFSGGGGTGLPAGGTTGQLLQKQSSTDGDADWATVAGGGVERKFDVKTYGALGDGTTDDTTAIQAALAAIPAAGGVLYFPAGRYLYAGSTLTLDRMITVEGDGGGAEFVSQGLGVTTIDFNSATGTLFTVTANSCAFKELVLRNTSVTTPSAGAGILISSNGDFTKYERIKVDGFYICVDVQAGEGGIFDGCEIVSPVLYGIKLRHILFPDSGGTAISNCVITGRNGRTAAAAIRIESGGGTHIVNTNTVAEVGASFVNAIDVAVGDNVRTVDLLISNCTIESFSESGIKGRTGSNASWWNIIITGNEFGQYVAGTEYAINFDATVAGDFNGLVINGNVALASPSSSSPAFSITDCTNVVFTGNVQIGFSDLVVASGSTFQPVYIGTDARLVSITGGAKLQARNPGTNTWADVDQWTNP